MSKKNLLCGIDEAGRGPLAGPLVVAGVVLERKIEGLADSKALSETKREKLYEKILENSVYEIIFVDNRTIDDIGLSKSLSYALKKIISAIDAVINRIPLLNTIYRVTKKVVNMFSGHEQKEAREVVYIEYPKEGLWVPAYVTNRENDRYILFVPTSPNPTSGFTLIAHESMVVKSKMNIEQATSFIISVGVDYDKSDEANNLPK